MSKILKIEEDYNITLGNPTYPTYNGIMIETEDEIIYFVIEHGQQCCENWGTYLYTPEKLENYIGADYLGYTESTCEQIANFLKSEYVSPDETCFLNIKTSNGDIDYAVYNSHNGYYSHDVVLKNNKHENR